MIQLALMLIKNFIILIFDVSDGIHVTIMHVTMEANMLNRI